MKIISQKIIRKTLTMFLAVITLTGCSKDDKSNPDDTGECWYKVTIDGQTTLPNQFGQDVVTIHTGINSRGEGLVTMEIHRDKGSSSGAGHFANRVYATLTRATSTGTYPIWFVDYTPIYLMYPVYKTYKSPTDTDLTFTLLENSDRRIHMTVSGVIRRIDKIDGEETYTDYVPLEVEIIVGREHVYEESYGGVMVSNAKCDCQNE